MNKIIWKDIDSSTIKGLLICELPPITKPKMRVQETAIDGVDGSIIEELGYETYDKSIRIGLTRNFDIDEVIKYFTGEGNVVFSNEPNKYYKAKIIEQIDYTRLLRFREATVTFRVQPFKYEYQEEEQATATGSVEGTEIKISDAKATEIKIDGRSSQDGEPTPDTPVEIESVGYENLFDGTLVAGRLNEDGSVTGASSELNKHSNLIETLPNTYYTYSCAIPREGVSNRCVWYDENSSVISSFNVTDTDNKTELSPSNAKYIAIGIYNIDGQKVMFEKGTIAHSYIPYGKYGIEVETTNGTDTNTSLIVLDQPLRSLPNGVKDIAYLKNNKLYVDRYVGSIVLNGSETNWIEATVNGLVYFYINLPNSSINKTSNLVSNYFISNTNNTIDGFYVYNGNLIIFNNGVATTLEEFKTWLSTHNTQVDYELATPTTEEYGDLTILELVDGENNISNSSDANMVIDYLDNKLIINNLGNYISKPTFEIEGAGTIKFILNGYSVFTYNFDDDGRVVIDSEKEDAYLDAVLKNRNMNGEFPKLEIGENIVTWDGLVKSMKVIKKSRWL